MEETFETDFSSGMQFLQANPLLACLIYFLECAINLVVSIDDVVLVFYRVMRGN